MLPPIKVQKHPSKFDRFEVVESVDVDVFGYNITIPAGFVTNGPSIPRPFWSIFPPHGKSFDPSVVHDYLYDTKAFENELGMHAARMLAETIYIVHLREKGVPNWQVKIFISIIRLFGRRHWKK